MSYWLMKSEPEVMGWDHLIVMKDKRTPWDGVRNYQARNFMRDHMVVGDEVFFYHSNTKTPGIVGIAKVVREAYPDTSAFDPLSLYFDPKSNPNDPRWFMVDIQAVRPLKRFLSLEELKTHLVNLSGFPLINRGNRLSVMPVPVSIWRFILSLESI